MPEKLDKEKLRAELAGGGYLKSAFDPTGQTPHYVRYMDKAERDDGVCGFGDFRFLPDFSPDR